MDTTKYETVVGLEVHAQISSQTKMFCSCSNDSFGKAPNTNVCPICMGFPGMLPALNEESIEKGVKAALALQCTIPEWSKFDRKNYFYPDSPKGFQISQFDKPVSQNGAVDITVNGKSKRIGVTRLHLEDDAGKLVHDGGVTFCDFNRSGCPLMEIVSEPDMRSVEEASAYAQEIRRIVRSVGSSECDMEKGMMRFDLNVSLRKHGAPQFGTKVEVKNLNSFRSLEKALVYEIERQTAALENGESIPQETRGWDDPKGITVSQRGKEEAHDYRYFPEPDLPPLHVSAVRAEEIKKSLGELPSARRERFVSEYGLTVEDAVLFAEEPLMAQYFEETARVSKDPKKAAAFISSIVLKYLNKDAKELKDCLVSAQSLGDLIAMVNAGKISNNQAKAEVFEEMYATGKSAAEVVKEKGLEVVSDTGAIEAICKKVLEANAAAAADYRAGKQAAVGFLVGQVMKESKGKANPAMVQDILRGLLQ